MEAAQRRVRQANLTASQSTGRTRRRAKKDAQIATVDHTTALAHQREVEAVAAPAHAAWSAATTEIHRLDESLRTHTVLERWDDAHARATHLHMLAAAVDDWQRWATGYPVSHDDIAQMARVLRSQDSVWSAPCNALRQALVEWSAAITPIAQTQLPERRSAVRGLELD